MTADAQTDAELLARLRRGDERAFTALVEQHHGALLRLALVFANNRAVAEEVVQETWLAVIEGLAGFEGRASLRTWLFTIVANRARTRAVREARSTPFSALESEAGPGPSVPSDRFTEDGHWREAPARWDADTPERLLERAETRAAVEAAVAALPANQRAVVTLRDLEGLSSEEACNALGLSETNQRVLLHRGRLKVRAALETLIR